MISPIKKPSSITTGNVIPQDGRVLRGLTENVSDEEQKLGPRLLFEIPLTPPNG